MTSLVVYDAVRARVEDLWTATPVAWPNEPFQMPQEGAPGFDGCWIVIEFEGRLFGQVSIGAGAPLENRWDEDGTVLAHVMAPKGGGERLMRGHASGFVDLFRGQDIGPIEFQDCEIGPGGADEDGNWWRITCRIEFTRRA
ncbi:hypothetical protein [Niveispirillum cyanobacteriorum]|uniref:Uncharacterized protein n=1 Tax=Niveispirillum cyanobacteriorum TaxID=1612173 RepID=A0A2K9NFT1_9PROT|nr:hypothetical protein [Niveispirillum cyanobacteriorum]AUN31949.1 hypothetical protein C0V82_16090 [Niveispirillum cyanobacteriorum]GGE85503.1 hypothetical protein GCM10011317_48370 [Niveispirillum cyanobacteriorum]